MKLLGIILCYNDADLLSDSIEIMLAQNHDLVIWDLLMKLLRLSINIKIIYWNIRQSPDHLIFISYINECRITS